ncbi:methionyl-tRNA formyltransferase [Rufibacter latericius]|uniref:Formyl transferase N-terminal domain-containing protein n=1 Tax=Rufibacter latericius TaxID=2487040 RepID=A0A3M9MJP5_9BACT|nr:formyltransferase family protein [Rufibacter latericius]RNI25761.1 hypothetical protein EFB08_12975 [Rufibacter latericius]
MKIKTILYCGHLSRYGVANLLPLLESSLFDVQEIVFGDNKRWRIFKGALEGCDYTKNKQFDKVFKNKTKIVTELISKISQGSVRFTHDVNSEEEIKVVMSYDLIISVAYPQIFSRNLISAPKKGAINFHPSYLPRCRGAHPVYWTIASKEAYGGISCHYMTEKLDNGPILARRKIDFDQNNITYRELYNLIEKQSPCLVKDVERFFIEGAVPVEQEAEYTYFRNDRQIHRKVYFQRESIFQISAKIRAGNAFAYNNKGLKIIFSQEVSISKALKSVTNKYEGNLPNGCVVEFDEHTVTFVQDEEFIKTGYRVDYSEFSVYKMVVKIKKLINIKSFRFNALSIGEILS